MTRLLRAERSRFEEGKITLIGIGVDRPLRGPHLTGLEVTDARIVTAMEAHAARYSGRG